MALRKNDSLRDQQADDFAALWAGGNMQIRTGGQPADPDTASPGSILAIIPLPSPAFGAAASGVISKAGTWSADASGTGIAGWARIRNAADTMSFDVSVGETGADLTIDDEDIVTGGVVTVTSFTITIPDGV